MWARKRYRLQLTYHKLIVGITKLVSGLPSSGQKRTAHCAGQPHAHSQIKYLVWKDKEVVNYLKLKFGIVIHDRQKFNTLWLVSTQDVSLLKEKVNAPENLKNFVLSWMVTPTSISGKPPQPLHTNYFNNVTLTRLYRHTHAFTYPTLHWNWFIYN